MLPELFSPQPAERSLIFETCGVTSILWEPVPRCLAVVQVFLQFTVVDDTVNLRGKFDASSSKRSRDISSQAWHRGKCREKWPEKTKS